MRLGQTLFGGAVAGLVLASGVATCSSQATGRNEVTKIVESQAQVSATGLGECRRVAGTFPVTLHCAALAYGSPSVDFRPLPVEIHGQAAATGRATVDFFVYAFGNAEADMQGSPIRRAKLFPLPGKGQASGTAEAETWQLAYGSPALATARGFGTTHYVGRGIATGQALPEAQPAVQLGGKGHASAPAHAQTQAAYIIGAAGHGLAPATPLGDAAVTQAGIRYFEGVGYASVTAQAVVETVAITQSQTGVCTATILAFPKCQIGAKGHASAQASGFADPIGASTGASAIPGDPRAVGKGAATLLAKGKGSASAQATASGAGIAEQTRVQGSGNGVALAEGIPHRTAHIQVSAQAAALARNVRSVHTQMAYTAGVLATASAVNERIALQAFPRPVLATATLHGLIQRTQYAAGLAQAMAQGQGANQVNDLVRAPSERTYSVDFSERLMVVEEEPRLLAA